MINKVTIGVLASLAIVFAVIAFKAPSVITIPTSLKIDASALGNKEVSAPIVNVPAPIVNVHVPEQKVLGAVSSPDISSTWLRVNGFMQYFADIPMKPATTTLCAIQAPTATSSLNLVAFQITTGTSTAATIDIGTSTTAFSTSTNLVSAKSIASGAQGYAVWRPAGGSLDDSKLAPNEWVVVKTAGSGLSGYTYGGACMASFTQL